MAPLLLTLRMLRSRRCLKALTWPLLLQATLIKMKVNIFRHLTKKVVGTTWRGEEIEVL